MKKLWKDKLFHILITIYRRFYVDSEKGIHHKMLLYA